LAQSSGREPYFQIVEKRLDIKGRFTNMRRVGAGHFSLVFTADDAQSGDVVALKVFNPEIGEPYRLECFRREAALLGSLSGQPDVIRLAAPIDQFTEMLTTSQGLPVPMQFHYYALELAESDVLASIANECWNPLELLSAFRAMCRAVQRIHCKRITHRDLKPENFLITANREVRLGDFGAASLVDGNAPRILSSYDIYPGDRRYTAPEMIALLHDENPAIAFKADIYSLGAILFELFTGQILGLLVFDAPFWNGLAGAMAAVSRAKRGLVFDQFVDQIVAGKPLPSLRDYGADVPGPIVDRLDRLYQSMAHLDYRKRLVDFGRIFNEINVCTIILRKERSYQHWRAIRQQRLAARFTRGNRS
jgi:serine/threonine protein kinase